MKVRAERIRMEQDARRERNWKRWGPYLAERQWGTVREDYSADGSAWDSFPHDHARSRAYRWGEDGLLGICDRECRLCFALALWNGRDPLLKERLFGLAGTEGNHGEDVKECYYYLDSTPTHSYMKALYKYPQAEFPYAWLVEENRRRGPLDPEFELIDTGIFDLDRYFDVRIEYAKGSPDDLLVRIAVSNRGPEAATLHLLPTLWFRNTWSWGRSGENHGPKPALAQVAPAAIHARHPTLGELTFTAGLGAHGRPPALLFTENETNRQRLYGVENPTPFVKDAFHEYVVRGASRVVNPARTGTKAAAYYRMELGPGETEVIRMRLGPADDGPRDPLAEFDARVEQRIEEADAFYEALLPAGVGEDERNVARQAYAGLLWSKQFYHYVVTEWLEGDPAQPPPPARRRSGRNSKWRHLYNRDVLSVPDKWEYPWYAAWDLAFHMIPMAKLDPELAKQQLVLLLREWYTDPNGQLPAYEWALGDVNPPVHAWAAWRVYKIGAERGRRDRLFLERVFQKLLINFTWWVNRKDPEGRNLFAGGFLGLDNIGVFDRSRPIPGVARLEQADGTAWMAFYCGSMLSIALELAAEDPAYEDVASTFLEHFVGIADAMNAFGGSGLWDEEEGLYCDQIQVDGRTLPLRLHSLVGLLPLIACEVIEDRTLARLPGFTRRMSWLLEHRADLARHITSLSDDGAESGRRLLAIPSRERLERMLRVVLDEEEFLSPHGIRSLSRIHARRPYTISLGGEEHRVEYAPGESTTGCFGGNSNWRGPVWYPVNYLLIEALERYHHFYGEGFRVECPTGSGRSLTLLEVAHDLGARLASPLLRDADGSRPAHGGDPRYATDPAWRDLVLFYECFHGDRGRGLGASHQTGWTALVTRLIEQQARSGARTPGARALAAARV